METFECETHDRHRMPEVINNLNFELHCFWAFSNLPSGCCSLTNPFYTLHSFA